MSSKRKSDPAAEQTAPEAPASKRGKGPSVNRVTLVGRLAADPELRYTSTGIAVASLRLVTNDRGTAEYHDVVVWRRLAETAGEYLVKGRLIYVAGRLHGRSWQAEDGSPRRRIEVVADALQFLSPKPAAASA